jgi:gliding motility-associated-like protein
LLVESCPSPLARREVIDNLASDPTTGGAQEYITYTLQFSDTLGCFENTYTYNVEVEPLFSVDAPTAFTPNGDGDNETFMVDGWGIKELLELRIYNRWGELLYTTSDLNSGWDGFYKGKLQNMETYIFQASILWYNDEIGEAKGNFKLLR